MILQSLEPIGTCGLYLINERHKRACIGYDLLPEYQGRGYMGEALPAMLAHTHSIFGIQRFQAEVLEENSASIKLF